MSALKSTPADHRALTMYLIPGLDDASARVLFHLSLTRGSPLVAAREVDASVLREPLSEWAIQHCRDFGCLPETFEFDLDLVGIVCEQSVLLRGEALWVLYSAFDVWSRLPEPSACEA